MEFKISKSNIQSAKEYLYKKYGYYYKILRVEKIEKKIFLNLIKKKMYNVYYELLPMPPKYKPESIKTIIFIGLKPDRKTDRSLNKLESELKKLEADLEEMSPWRRPLT